MFVKTRPGECAPIHSSPDGYSRITGRIPHATVVEAAFFDGLWYHIKWNGQSGFVAAENLSVTDPSSMRWAERYGHGCATDLQEKVYRKETAMLQEDLNLFFYPFSPQIVIDGYYGQQTRAAVIKFQFIRSLRQDGIADGKTKQELYYATQRLRALSKMK